jgi:hypothetical protein
MNVVPSCVAAFLSGLVHSRRISQAVDRKPPRQAFGLKNPVFCAGDGNVWRQ